MASQSITNKLVANIRQANDVSTNFFTGTNVVCIDTSNRRIGIDTKTPTWSIDISGVESYNGVKCHNLDISGTADISYANIGFLRTPSLFIDVIDISNGYFKKIDASLIDVNDVNFNTISGDFIYSNNTINGNLLDCSYGIIHNNLDICGTLTAKDFTFGEDVELNKVTITSAFITQPTSESKFNGKVEFLNINNPVQYRTISGNHINTFSISCDNLQVNQQADFSSINVSAEASFNTINVSGDAVFSTISTSNILIQGLSIEQFVTNNSTSQLSKHITDISINALYGKQLYIQSNIGNTFVPPPDNFNSIDKLIINDSLDLSNNTNGETSLILPYKELTNINDRRIGNIFYSKDSTGVINGLQIIKSTPQNAIDDTPTGDTITLKQVLTKYYMLEASGTNFHDCGNEKYKCVGMDIHSNQVTGDNIIDDIYPFYVDISNITTSNIEINANITVSLNNDKNGNDVDALNYEFFIFGLTSIDEIANDIKSTKLVSNKNTILVFDNSYNYNSTSLHYIGSKNVIDGIIFGVSYENVPFKDLSLNLVNFSASIKGIN